MGKKPEHGYDVRMIRDFLDHLIWELRVKHFEMISQKINPELAEKIGQLMKRRNTVGLSCNYALTPDPSGEVSIDEAKLVFKAGLRDRTQRAIEALEALEPTLREALFCASKPNTINQIDVNAKSAMTFFSDKGQP